jgi:type I restriction enzyme S subunit
VSGVKEVALGDVASIVRTTVEPSDIREGTLYVGLENITPGGRFTGVAGLSPGEVTSTKFVFRESDVLFGKLRPYLAKIARPSFGVCSTDILPIRPGPKLDRNYLAHFLLQPAIVALTAQRATGANLPRLSPRELERFRLPLPSLHEQQRIARILDVAEKLGAKRRDALSRTTILGDAMFIHMFGDPATNPKKWPTYALAELAIKFSDGPFGSNLKSSHYTDEGTRVLRLQNIGRGEFCDGDHAYIGPGHFATLAKHQCVPGDIIIATLGDPNLRACILPESIAVALNKADCVQMRVDAARASNQYVCALLNQSGTLALAQSRMAGQTRIRISMGRLRTLPVPVAPRALQEKFATSVDSISATRIRLQCHLSCLHALFASLQDRAFKGEL